MQDYIHGTSAEEQERLALMNRILNDACLEQLELCGGERVLELGAGTGIFAAELARAVGDDGRVLAIERDPEQIAGASALPPALDLLQGDVYAPPLAEDEWGSFDLVHARFLLEHLERPAEAVAVMVRAARPGGRIALVDDDHSLMRFDPDPGGMAELWSDYAECYRSLGNDPWIGRRLVALLAEAGARPVRTTQIDYGACAGQAVFPAVVENLAEVVGGARQVVVERTDWTAASFDEALASFRSWARRPNAALWYALPFALAERS